MANDNNFAASGIGTSLDDLRMVGVMISRLKDATFDNADGVISMLSSEDSNLADSWNNAKSTARRISVKAEDLVKKLQEELQNYITNTIANETNTEQAVSSINTSLQSHRDALDKITF